MTGLRFGIVTEQDINSARVRVSLLGDDLVTQFIPVLVHRATRDKFYCLPDINDQVAVIMDEHCEDGVVLGSIYSKADVPGAVKGADVWGVEFEDGTKLSYNRSSHKLSIDVNGDVNITANKTTVSGDLQVSGGISATGDIVAGTTSLQLHVHTSAAPGSPTSPPLP